jgi:pyruvate/2-oxoglutarate dehydrogenase complex dihydrolipoamide acyltransferase (E2) component
VDTPSGLIVPVIRDADLLRLSEIGACAADLAARAKQGKLSPAEYTGSSFTVSNLGMFGIECFVPILNTPESGILGVGKIEKQPVVVNDEVVIRPMMCLTLTYDHRVTDGAPAAQFLARVKQYLENPYLLL